VSESSVAKEVSHDIFDSTLCTETYVAAVARATLGRVTKNIVRRSVTWMGHGSRRHRTSHGGGWRIERDHHGR
jgi:hypothetical protein